MDPDETKKVQLVCPICQKTAFVPIPTYIFERKQAGIAKVQIIPDVVCEHQFVAFIDKNFMARGYDRIDFQLSIKPPEEGEGAESDATPDQPRKIKVTDVVAKFGVYATTYLFHAYAANLDIYLVTLPTDAPNLGAALDELFTRVIPEGLDEHPRDRIRQIDRHQFRKLKVKEEEWLVLDSSGIVSNTPWKRKKLRFEEDTLKAALGENTEARRVAVIGEALQGVYERVRFVAELLAEKKKILDNDLKDALKKQFGEKISKDSFEFLRMMLQRRVKGGKKLAKRIRGWQDNLREMFMA